MGVRNGVVIDEPERGEWSSAIMAVENGTAVKLMAASFVAGMVLGFQLRGGLSRKRVKRFRMP